MISRFLSSTIIIITPSGAPQEDEKKPYSHDQHRPTASPLGDRNKSIPPRSDAGRHDSLRSPPLPRAALGRCYRLPWRCGRSSDRAAADAAAGYHSTFPNRRLPHYSGADGRGRRWKLPSEDLLSSSSISSRSQQRQRRGILQRRHRDEQRHGRARGVPAAGPRVLIGPPGRRPLGV